MKKRSLSVNLTISLIIVVGFALSGFSSFFSFQAIFKSDIEAVSELTSENIYVNINNLMERPINVSIAMAHDTFLRDFMIEEGPNGLEQESLDTMKGYLASYKEKYNFDSVFLVSTKTGAYYHYKSGLDRVMTEDNPENEWYYRFIEDPIDCSLNVDNDETKNDVITIFVNCKLYDENKKLLGIVGVGMETPYIQQFLMENEQAYGVHAYLIDAKGNIQLSSVLTEFEHINLFEDENFADMADAINISDKTLSQRWYHSSDTDGYIITRYVPNLNWYLVVEKSTEDFMGKMLAQLGVGAIFMLFVVLVVIKITTDVIKKYNERLAVLAERDQLTGIRNRTSYELEMENYSSKLQKYQHFGIGVLDLNNLKATNDIKGHQVGDEYLKTFSAMLCRIFEHCPVSRIGGDEFAIIFQNMQEEAVIKQWEQLLQQIEELKKSGGISISAAFGYAFWDPDRLNTVEKIFKAADDKMYQDKEQIKHRDEK